MVGKEKAVFGGRLKTTVQLQISVGGCVFGRFSANLTAGKFVLVSFKETQILPLQ
jgi:hypothetical protein